MDDITLNYRRSELHEVAKDLDHLPNLQIRGKAGATKWLSITPEEFAAISAILAPAPQRTSAEESDIYRHLGAGLAELLYLKKDRTTGRYATTYGTKSDEGLGRTVARIVREALDTPPDNI